MKQLLEMMDGPFGRLLQDKGLIDRSNTLSDYRACRARELADGTRCEIQKSLAMVPVIPNGWPDWEHRLIRSSLDLIPEGIDLELSALDYLITPALMLVFYEPDGTMRCAGIELTDAQQLDTHSFRIKGKVGGYAEDLLRPESLTPQFNPSSMSFEQRFSEQILEKWVEIGVVRATWADRVQVCPKCHGLPTFRPGCCQCGSGLVANERLIHHFACAHVGLAADFETHPELRCPKCRARRLVVGADFEYLVGPYRCLQCPWNGSELEQVGHCLRCGCRFPGRQATVLELRGFHANRLDLLALLPAPRSTFGDVSGTADDGHSPLRPEQDLPVSVGLRT